MEASTSPTDPILVALEAILPGATTEEILKARRILRDTYEAIENPSDS